jgi:hypothetical protein
MTQCVVGQTESILGHVTDQGTYPGPLEGVPTNINFILNLIKKKKKKKKITPINVKQL